MESLLRKQEERSIKSDSPPPPRRKLKKLTAASNTCGSHSTIQEPITFQAGALVDLYIFASFLFHSPFYEHAQQQPLFQALFIFGTYREQP
jgi:hypothetical protein